MYAAKLQSPFALTPERESIGEKWQYRAIEDEFTVYQCDCCKRQCTIANGQWPADMGTVDTAHTTDMCLRKEETKTGNKVKMLYGKTIAG